MKSAQKKIVSPATKSKKIKKGGSSKPVVETDAAGKFKCPHCPRVFEKS
jgi:hypothetical protein